MLGDTGSRRIDTLVHDLVEHSQAAGDIVQGDAVGPAMLRLRTFMFEHVYLGPPPARSTRRSSGSCGALRLLRRAAGGAAGGRAGASEGDRVIDYLAGMTDRFAIRAWSERFEPQGFAGI